MIHSRNYFTAVPQASTPRHSINFWAFFALSPNFSTFSLKISIFSPERATGTVARYFSQLSQGLRLLFSPFWQCCVGLMEYLCSNQEKHSKTRKIAIFAKKSVTDLHQRFPIKKGAISKCSRTMTYLSDISGPKGGIFATQFLHIQTS